MRPYIVETNEIVEDGVTYVVKTYSNGSVVKSIKSEPTPETYTPEPTQLDRIESMVAKSQEDIANEAIDNYTLELMEAGVIQ